MSFSTLYHQQTVNPHHYLAFCHFYGSVIIQQYTLIYKCVASINQAHPHCALAPVISNCYLCIQQVEVIFVLLV